MAATRPSFCALTTRRFLCLAAGLVLVLLFTTSRIDTDLLRVRISQIDIGAESRVQQWDWKDTAEEEYCRSPHETESDKELIPNVAHFIMLSPAGSDSNITFAQFLAFKSAIVRMKAREVKIHTYGLDLENTWWQQLKDRVTVVHLRRDELPGPHGLPLSSLQLAHQADIFRLHILQREGGIYLDTDIFTLKPFTDLLSSPRDTLLGHEGGNRWGLCNAVIVSRPNSTFISKWQDTYQSFDPNGWNEHSVHVPKRLQVQRINRELVCPLSPSVFFWPTWAEAHVRYMHDVLTEPRDVEELRGNMTAFGGAMYANQLAVHTWMAGDILANLTAERVKTELTRFNILVRGVVDAEW